MDKDRYIGHLESRVESFERVKDLINEIFHKFYKESGYSPVSHYLEKEITKLFEGARNDE